MSICINSNYSPMFKGKLPLNPKVSKVVGTIKSDNLTAIKAPIATMAALAGVAIVQGHKNITTEDIQAKNVALCEAEQVPLAPTVASILSSLEEPVIFEGQKILSQDVDITNVDFKPLINKLKETNANEKPLRISCNGVEYDVDYGIAKYNTSSYKLEEITIT